MTDSLERFLQDLRFDVPAGLVERANSAVAADASGARQAGRERVHNRGDFDTQRQTWGPALVAILLAVAIVATLLFVAHARQAVPANRPTAPSPSPVSAVVDPSNCRLPVSAAGPTSQQASGVGFVDTHTGQYTEDRSASVAGLPYTVTPTPSYYSPALKRWLPNSVSEISPDGRSYAWVRLLPDGSTLDSFKTAELHRYDVAGRTDHALWTSTLMIYVWRWDAAGILVSAQPPGSLRAPTNWWLVDPVTGAASRRVAPSPASFFPFTPLAGDPTGATGAGYHSLGVDAQGHTIWWFFNLDKRGAVDWVFYETAPGQRVYIYRGTQGDATGFDPQTAIGDSTGIWFTDYNGARVIWHWQLGTSLRKVTVTGLPATKNRGNSSAVVSPLSPCF